VKGDKPDEIGENELFFGANTNLEPTLIGEKSRMQERELGSLFLLLEI